MQMVVRTLPGPAGIACYDEARTGNRRITEEEQPRS
jgi:hypothetical protein